MQRAAEVSTTTVLCGQKAGSIVSTVHVVCQQDANGPKMEVRCIFVDL